MRKNIIRSDFKKIKEEETKIRYIFPLFEILGWNFSDYNETSLEYSSGFDERVYREILGKIPNFGENFNKAKIIDCVFRVNNKEQIYLEAKKLSIHHLDSLDTPDGKILMKYAKLNDVRCVVFTNFLTMRIMDALVNQEVCFFKNPDEYLVNFETLKVLMRSNQAVL